MMRPFQRIWRLACHPEAPSRPSDAIIKQLGPPAHVYFNNNSKPYVRWWGLRGPFLECDKGF
jgi:hypothetical protein